MIWPRYLDENWWRSINVISAVSISVIDRRLSISHVPLEACSSAKSENIQLARYGMVPQCWTVARQCTDCDSIIDNIDSGNEDLIGHCIGAIGKDYLNSDIRFSIGEWHLNTFRYSLITISKYLIIYLLLKSYILHTNKSNKHKR